MSGKHGMRGWWVAASLALLALPGAIGQDISEFEDEYADQVQIADPLQPFNRVIYAVNDKLYFWLMKPLALGYEAVVPMPARQGIHSMFDNVAMPKRFANCLLQGRFHDGGTELARFGLNSTVGLLGWRDVATKKWSIKQHSEDTGQSFGVWGIGRGISLTLPVFGPSNARDAVGLVGDVFLDPIHYLSGTWVRVGLNAEKRVNNLSLMLGEYEKTKASALDHYLSLRDMYEQYRRRQVAE